VEVKKMPSREGPSMVELVLQVLRRAPAPLTLDELLAKVNAISPITSRNPRNSLRNAITNTELIQATGDGRYGYLPTLVEGAAIRHLLSADELKHRRLVLSWEVIFALWPGVFEAQKRRDRGPRILELPDGQRISAELELFGSGRWGTRGGTGLWEWLKEEDAAAGDSLIFRLGKEGGPHRLELERRAERDEERITARNRELADAAEAVLKRSRGELLLPELAQRLLARGAYGDPCPPDPLAKVLFEIDPRFYDNGLGMVRLASTWEPGEAALAREQARLLERLFPPLPDGEEIFRLLEEGREEEALEALFEVLEATGLFRGREDLLEEFFGATFSTPAGWIRARREVGEASLKEELAQRVYRFKAALKYRRGLWRRIEIRGDQTLDEFDEIMREAFNHDLVDHLSEFYLGTDREWRSRGLGTHNPFGESEGGDVLIGDLGLSEGDKLTYVYDFGDDIQHILTLEEITEPEEGAEYPRVVARNKPRYKYCVSCKEQGKKTVATWICIHCSTREDRQVVLCEDCLDEHEDHYVDEMLY
jgi:hypothetical protein